MSRPLCLAALCCAFAVYAHGTSPRVRIARPRADSAAPAPSYNLQYYGGHVIPNVKVYQVNWTAGGQPDMSAFFGAVTNSTYLDWLNEYDTNIKAQVGSQSGLPGTNQLIGRGVFAGKFTITPSSANAGGKAACGANGAAPQANCCNPDAPTGSTCIQDPQIADELQKQITAGHLPANDENALYFVYFPRGLVVGQGGTSSCQAKSFCAYHGTFSAAVSGESVYYAVMPDFSTGSGCDVGCGDSTLTTTLQALEEVSSHEMAESITDAEVGIGTNVDYPLGWYWFSSSTQQGEIADICDSQPHSAVSSYIVEPLWSDTAKACVATRQAANDFAIALSPNGSTIAAGASTTVSVTSTNHGTAQTLALSVNGLPAGVTASFDNTSISSTGSATLTLSADASAAPAKDAVVQVVAVNGASVTHTAGLLLQVTAGDFSLSISPGSAQTIAPTGTQAFTVTANAVSGSPANISLAVSGLPTGVAGNFDQATIQPGGSATLTLTSSGAPASAATIFTVTGTDDAGLARTTTGSIQVLSLDDFALSLSSSSLSLQRGSSTSITVDTSIVSGSPGSIKLTVSGLPGGVTSNIPAAGTTVSAGSSTTLTLSASSGALITSGAAVTVTGTSGTMVHTAGATLDVTGTPDKPTISISNPADGATLSGVQEIDVLAQAAASSSLSSIALKAVPANPLLPAISIPPPAGNPTSPAFFWNTSEFNDGAYTITATATDQDMGAASASISVTVDNSAHGSVSGSAGGKGGCLSSTGAVGGLALLGLFALRRKR